MRAAVRAGRGARLAGRIPRRLYARASTSDDGLAEFR
jgi:thiazole synthase